MLSRNAALSLTAALLLAACVSEPTTGGAPAAAPSASSQSASPAPRAASKVAFIVSGDVNLRGATRFGPEVSVVEVDGKPTDSPQGPIALTPGTHSVSMKCGDTTRMQTLRVAAGEVYLFAMRVTPGERGCTGYLSRIRSAGRLV